ncbi:zinc metalloprotease TldD [Sulfurisphaera ohwakuensis]|uniref:TldD protein n=1 Tax=Sulfurisphaera ohwakuensis TaxID=69656 RepID=A0A650CH65_SULOH|nr:zinc metalloprotease TldD [Sulfurisphaera ohwakuensis]MBB5252304.1 TldD protein [Sulfurisphaera ohwakuensis]QGR17231.1 TldD/PmbA family protein [Sulfurisphaera ohwakuensis]
MDLLKKAEELGATFADLRIMKIKELSLTVTEDRELITTNGIDQGFSLRVLYRSNWGYKSSTGEVGYDDVKDAINVSYGDEKTNIIYMPPKKDIVDIKIKYDFNRSIEEKFKDLRKIRESVFSLSDRIKSVNIRYYESHYEKEYYSTEDREIKQKYVISGFSIVAVARENDVVASAYVSKSTFQGYPLEVFDINDILQTLKIRIEGQLKGKPPKADKYPVVLAPEVVGVFAHEAIGHLAEADLAINGILYELRGKQIAPESVNIIDSPVVDYPMGIGVTIYDDDGIEGRDVYIIKNGVVNEFLTDRFYSSYLGQKPTGNARAEDFRNPIIIRMRNTYISPGSYSYDEMIKEVKQGILLVSPRGGQTSPDGTFQFGIQEAYKIENGEVKEPLRNVGISGYTIETLRDIKAISKEFNVSPGYCGKEGQSVPVGVGGSYVLVENMKVGGIID